MSLQKYKRLEEVPEPGHFSILRLDFFVRFSYFKGSYRQKRETERPFIDCLLPK